MIKALDQASRGLVFFPQLCCKLQRDLRGITELLCVSASHLYPADNSTCLHPQFVNLVCFNCQVSRAGKLSYCVYVPRPLISVGAIMIQVNCNTRLFTYRTTDIQLPLERKETSQTQHPAQQLGKGLFRDNRENPNSYYQCHQVLRVLAEQKKPGCF